MASSFSRHIHTSYDGADFVFHKVELDDHIFVVVQIDGAVDTTFDLPLNSKQSINILSNISNLDKEDGLGIEPALVVGDHSNLKIAIVASQIGKMILKHMKVPKDVVLSIGSKWFGKGDETDPNDFNKLMFVLQNISSFHFSVLGVDCQLVRAHKLSNGVVIDAFSSFLVLSDKVGNYIDTFFLHLRRQKLAFLVGSGQQLQLPVVVAKERHVAVGYVDLGVSSMKIDVVVSEADILVAAPCNAGKNLAWINAGLANFNLSATSLHTAKYGSWSMAHGIKQGVLGGNPNTSGNEDGNECSAHVLQVREDKGVLRVKANSYYVLTIDLSELLHIFNSQFGFKQELLVVRQLNDQRNIEHVLQPFGENERYHVSQVNRVRGRTSSSVQEEGLTMLIQVQDFGKISFREKHASFQERVGLMAGDFSESSESLWSNGLSTKLGYQFVVVNTLIFSVHNSTFDLPRSHNLFCGVDIQFADFFSYLVCHLSTEICR